MKLEDRALVATNAESDYLPVPRVEAEEFESLLSIDEDHLDGEWVRQPTLHAQCSRFAARAYAAVGRARNELKALSAQKNMCFRKEGIEGLPRVTDEAIKAAVAADREIQDLENRVVILESLHVYVAGLVRNCEGRISSLKWLSTFKGHRLISQDKPTGEPGDYVTAATEFARSRHEHAGGKGGSHE